MTRNRIRIKIYPSLTPEYIYAIRVMTTKKGKPRKKKGWARQNNRGRWCIGGQSIAWLAIGGAMSIWTGLQIMKRKSKQAQSALGCQCRVVKIELLEVECE